MINLAFLPVAKLAGQVVSGLGVSKILGDIVKNNVPITTTTEKVLVKTGSFVLGGILWEQSANYIERSVNEIVGWAANRYPDKIILPEEEGAPVTSTRMVPDSKDNHSQS